MKKRIAALLIALLALMIAVEPMALAAKAKKARLAIVEVEYDAEDSEIDINFSGRVQYRKAKVVVKDASGKKYKTKIREKDSDDMDVYVRGLIPGETYTVTVSGVRPRGKGAYRKVTAKFIAIDD